MLSEYQGPSNTNKIFQYLVGEKIMAAFQDRGGHIYIILESGDAIVFGGGMGSPTFWQMKKDEIDQLITRRKTEIEQKLAELRNFPGIDLP